MTVTTAGLSAHGSAFGQGHVPGALPTLAPEHCVHNKAVIASCRACADACPRGAWTVDDDGVALDAQACDGCGLCAPACPQSVIAHPHRAARRMERGKPVAFAACSQTGLRNGPAGRGDAIEGVVPCLNALGPADLLALHGTGVRRLVIARGTCATCPRGSSTAMRLERAVEELNLLLEGRGLSPLTLSRRSAVPWQAYLTFDTQPDAGKPAGAVPSDAPSHTTGLSRRALFRLPRGGGRGAATTRREPQAASPAPLGRRLPAPAASGTASGLTAGGLTAGGLKAGLAGAQPWPWVPSIDASACEGCAGCARLCPTGAIRLDEQAPAFRIAVEDCTGCRLCTDVCRPGALILERLAPRRQTAVPLALSRCPSCGVVGRRPERRATEGMGATPTADPRCPVCRKTRRHHTLYQVLD